MKLFITGATGFVGSALCRALAIRGDTLTALSRQPGTARRRAGVQLTAVSSPTQLHQSPDAVINLARLPIVGGSWTDRRKKALYARRVELTRELVDAMAQWQQPPKVLVSASAVGYYGDCGGRWVDENTPPHPEYTHELCAAWEQAAMRAEDLGIRVCIIRIGLVLGPNGGLLKQMSIPFRLGLGGRLGSGEQWMSWVHRDDLVRAILYLLDHETLRGAFNVTAPSPVRNRDFSQILARQLHRPAVLPVPAVLLRLTLGEMSGLLLTGQRVLPCRLQDAGFGFHHPDCTTALRDLI